MSETTHQGSCHCGAVAFRATLDLDAPAVQCNCSMCGRSGTLLQFVPPTSFELQQGEDHLVEYKFNKNVIGHVHCKTCGIKPFARGAGPQGPMVAINVRCLDGFDLAKTKTHDYDGKTA
jgi:hypothetical protein